MADETDVAAELAALKARVEELERKGKPSAPMRAEPAPFRDLTANASMPPSALREMATAVSNVVIRQIVTADRVRGELGPLSRGGATPTVAQSNRSGWRSPSPLEPPAGVALADKLIDVADARDRAELIEKEARRLAQSKAEPDAA